MTRWQLCKVVASGSILAGITVHHILAMIAFRLGLAMPGTVRDFSYSFRNDRLSIMFVSYAVVAMIAAAIAGALTRDYLTIRDSAHKI